MAIAADRGYALYVHAALHTIFLTAVPTSRRKLTAWIALAAMLFAAVSPAIAAVLFSDQPTLLGRMLALPTAATPSASQAIAAAGICTQQDANAQPAEQPYPPAQHGGSAAGSHDDTRHAAHASLCAFCLNASAAATLPAAAAGVWLVALPAVFLPAEHELRPSAVLAATRHPRDPPLYSLS